MIAPSVPQDKLEKILSCAFAMVSKESASLGLPDFPLDNLPLGASILVRNLPKTENPLQIFLTIISIHDDNFSF